MNTDNNHLVDLLKMTEEEKKRLLQLYEPVPYELQFAANKKLAGNTEATVSMHSGGKLSKWAASQRKLRRKKNHIQKQSRKKNR